MANAASKCLFLFFLSLLSCCSSGTLVGFSYHASGNTAVSSPGRTLSFLKQNKINPSQIRVFVEDPRVLSNLSKTGVAVDLYLNVRQVENIISSESSSKSWLKTHIMPFISQVDIKSIVAISSNDDTRKSSLPRVLSSLKTLHSVLTSLPFDQRIKVSVAFSLSFLENLRRGNEGDLHSICSFINEVRSVVIEANIDKELSMGDKFVRSMIEKAGLAHSVLTCSEVPMVLTIKSPAVPNTTEVAQFADKVSKALENETQIASRLVGLYAEVDCMEDFAQKELKREEEQIFPSSSRELLSDLHPKTTSHDVYGSPTIFPTNSTPPLPTTSPYNVSTVPATNPVTITPVNPATPVEVSSATPPPSNPVSPPLPVTNPAIAPPTTNPATTYPPPPGGVPSTTPVTNPVTPPATSNAPAVPGQSWCVAKSGAPQAALQAALDYACGMGGVDCSQIQQGGSCYDPNSLQNHASYAFNSYYQKHPVSTSCDFGGVATMVSANPSTGSCIYASSSSSSTPTTPTSNQTTTNPPPPSTIPPPPSTIPPPTSPTPNQTTTNPPPPSTIPSPPSTIPPPTSPTPNQTTTNPLPPSTIPPPTSIILPPLSPTPNQTTTNPPPPSTIPPPTSTIPPPTSTTPPPTPTRNHTITNPPPTSTTPPPTSTIPPQTSAPTPAITSFPPPGEGVLGYGTPPSGLNSSNPGPSGTMPEFEPDSPPSFNTSISTSPSLQPSFGCILFGTALVTRNIFLNM